MRQRRAEKRARRPRSLSPGRSFGTRFSDGDGDDRVAQQMTSFSTHGIAHRLINFRRVFTLIARG